MCLFLCPLAGLLQKKSTNFTEILKGSVDFCGCSDHNFTSLTIAEQGILKDLLAFIMQLLDDFHENRPVTDADKGMNPVHFGSDQAGTRIQILINL